MNYEFEDLNKEGFGPVNGGVSEVVYLAPKSWFESIKTPAAPFVDPGDQMTIKETHTFTAGKGFVTYQCAPQKNTLGNKTKGDIGSMGQMQELKVFIPGSKKQVHEQVKNMLNVPFIGEVPDADCDNNLVYQLGCDCNSLWVSDAPWESATTKDGSKGYLITMIYDDGFLFYEGEITKKP